MQQKTTTGCLSRLFLDGAAAVVTYSILINYAHLITSLQHIDRIFRNKEAR